MRRTIVAAVPVLVAGWADATRRPPPPCRTRSSSVAGSFSPALANEPLAARLRADGYTVRIFKGFPTLGTQDINLSAAALNTFADGVRAATGAAKVDLIGHGPSGLVARSYVKGFGGAGEVDSLITLGAPNEGTYVANLVSLPRVWELPDRGGVRADEHGAPAYLSSTQRG